MTMLDRYVLGIVFGTRPPYRPLFRSVPKLKAALIGVKHTPEALQPMRPSPSHPLLSIGEVYERFDPTHSRVIVVFLRISSDGVTADPDYLAKDVPGALGILLKLSY